MNRQRRSLFATSFTRWSDGGKIPRLCVRTLACSDGFPSSRLLPSAASAADCPALFGGISVVTGQAMRVEPMKWPGGLYQPQSHLQYAQAPFTFKAIPYCFWANREPGEMLVWVRAGEARSE